MKIEHFPGWDEGEEIKVIESDGISGVYVRGRPYMRWETGDEASQRMAIVQLYDSELGTQEDLARAFGLHVNSVQRYVTDFARDGMRGLISRQSGPRTRWKITPRLRAEILTIVLKEGVFKLDDIREKLEEDWNERVSLASIREVLLENGFADKKSIRHDAGVKRGELFDAEDDGQLYLQFNGDTELEEMVSEEETKDIDCGGIGCEGCNNETNPETKGKRYYSHAQRTYLDQLEQGDYNTYAGALLLTPLLEQYSFLPVLKRIIDIPTYEGYSLEELCLTLTFFDVFGFRSMEDFKRAYPEEFGLLIGRSYSPSIFTLRRFMHTVRELEIGEKLVEEFASEYLKTGIARYGAFYIDGHFFPYYGVQPIRKGWHAVRQVPMKGSYHFLGMDDKFKPWLFLARSSSEDLLEKIPEMIKKVRNAGKEAGLSNEETANLVVVFDREGYSAKLFRNLEGKEEGAEIPRTIFVTWAKYTDKWVNDISEECFGKEVTVDYEIQESKKIKYFETQRTMNKYGKIRAIVIQSGKDKKRSAIYTNGAEKEITAERVVQLICRRWGQENAIKELMMKHLINYMPGYVFEHLEEQPLVDNPRVKKLKKAKAKKASELHKLKIKLANKILSKEHEAPGWEEIKKSELETLGEIARIDNEMLVMQEGIAKLPAQIRFDEAHDGKRMMRLNYEKKRFLDCIKVFTYNLKETMCRILLGYYDHEKEILPALSMILERGGYVKLEGGQLKVELRRFKNREIDYAARHLCEHLNAMNPVTLDRFRFPMHFQVQ